MKQNFEPTRTVDRAMLAWLPGETLFSLISRHHRLWGHAVPWRTAEVMFGEKRIGVHHDLPSGLGRLSARTQGVFGDELQVGRERTLLKYYLPFLAPARSFEALSTMQGDSVAHLKFRLGLLTSQFGANHALKACPSCMRDDFERCGWSYWHLEHQYPGVWMCRQHGEPILRSILKSTGVERFGWHLPNAKNLVQDWSSDTRVDEGALITFSKMICDLVELPVSDGWLGPNIVQDHVRNCLESREWISPSGKVRLDAMAKSYLAFCAPLRVLPELSILPATPDEAKTHVNHLLRPLRTGIHPLRLLLALSWIFHDSAEFAKICIEQPSSSARHSLNGSTGEIPSSATKRAEHDLQSQVLTLIAGGVSATAAARVAGVDVGTAISWAVRAGFGVSRRPKVLKPEVRALLVTDLQRGMDRQEAAKRHGVSLATISRVFQTEPDVHGEWKSAREKAARDQARCDWTLLFAAYPHVGITLLRATNPSAYAWLYRNDRDWLKQHAVSKHVPPSSGASSRVRWDDRDVELSKSVQEAVLLLHELNRGKRLRLWQIYQAVPELKRKLSVLHRLVLTKRILEQALQKVAADSKSF